MTRYWALRTDQSRREFMWCELREGRLRQGWGYRADQDLELLARLRHGANRLGDHQRDAWRGNRRLLPTEPGAMQVGDLVMFLHLPRYGTWSIARVTGGYRYEISDMPNAVDGSPDYGHIRDVELLTSELAIDPERDAVSDGLRAPMRNRQRMWSIDPWAEEIERLADVRHAAPPRSRP
jgi:hypothetical protein